MRSISRGYPLLSAFFLLPGESRDPGRKRRFFDTIAAMEFRLGVVQNSPKFLKAPENIRACFELMDKQDADLWVLPEFFASGYNFKTKKEAARCAESADGP